jgi:steroid delta-isomerase-like uncharacterized protein
MDNETRRKALVRYYEALNTHDPALLAEFVAEDIVFDDDFLQRQLVHGSAAFCALFEGLWDAFPDMTFRILDGPFFAEGNPRFAVHTVITGTLAKPVPHLGLSKVGGAAETEFMGVYALAGERVASIRVCLDPTTLTRQLG